MPPSSPAAHRTRDIRVGSGDPRWTSERPGRIGQSACLIVLLLAYTLLAGCATRAPLPAPPVELARQAQPDSVYAPFEARIAAAHGADASGFRLLERSDAALRYRLMLIDTARHSLDLQYYVWFGDTVGQLMMSRVIAAADRGVRVRILFDDLNSLLHDMASIEIRDAMLSRIDSHPNIEIRLFNSWRERSLFGRGVEAAADFSRLNRRMHNKQLIADNRTAVIGGRNIGDEYFQADEVVAFRDLDVLATGPVVRELSAAFDRYWNAERVITTRALPDTGSTRKDLRDALAQEVAALRESHTESLSGFQRIDALGPEPGPGWGPWTGGDAEILIDDPGKTDKGVKRADLPIHRLLRHGMEARQELLIASPYFVPGENGVEWLRQVQARPGVSVRILTNSLAATDVAVVHAGYSRYRRPLLAEGIQLYELKPRKERRAWGPHLLRGSSRASLHGKAVVFDRQIAYVGSMNLDPRSVVLNTESGLLLRGAAIAGQVADFIEQAMRPERSYRLALEAVDDEAAPALVWHDQQSSGAQVHRHDPRTGASLRAYVKVLSLLPIEDEL